MDKKKTLLYPESPLCSFLLALQSPVGFWCGKQYTGVTENCF